MPDLLTTLRTKPVADADTAEVHLVPIGTQQPKRTILAINHPDDVLEALKSKPDYKTLGRVLRWLNKIGPRDDDFDVRNPGPKALQIVFILVNDTIPDYWETLKGEDSQEKRLLIQCLRSVAGIGAVTSRLRFLLSLLKDSQKPAQVTPVSKTQPVEGILNALEAILAKEDLIAVIWHDIEEHKLTPSQKSLQWKEFSSLVASGKVLSIASEANVVLRDLSSSIDDECWVGNGAQYTAWFGRCMRHATKVMKDDDDESQKAMSQLLSKGLTLGYIGSHDDSYHKSPRLIISK